MTDIAELMNGLRNGVVGGGRRTKVLSLIDHVEDVFRERERAATALHGQLAQTQRELREKAQELELAEQKMQVLEERIRLELMRRFGRRSEQWTKAERLQAKLFNEAELAAQGEEPEPEPEPEPTDEAIEEKKRRRKERRAKRPEGGRKPLPAHLPRETTVIDAPEADQVCACGRERAVVTTEVSERLQMRPVEYYVERIERVTRACPAGCDGPTAPPPVPQVVAKSMVGSSVIAHMIVGKFKDALPFHRQNGIFARDGISISRQTMGRTAVAVAERLGPLIELIRRASLDCPVWGMDETPVRVLSEEGKPKTGQSWMWCWTGERAPPGEGSGGSPFRFVMFRYDPRRNSEAAEQALEGFHGILMTDGLASYAEPVSNAGIIHAACMAHVRRKFHDVLKSDPRHERSREAIAYIARLYRVERDTADVRPKDRLKARQEKSAGMLEQFAQWLFRQAATMLPKSAFGQAVNYAINNLDGLRVYLTNPLVPIDNNCTERAIRPFTVGRKNWAFSGTAEGAKASAALYSIIETAKANRVEPFHYLRFVLGCMERYHDADVPWEHLLPTPAIRDFADSIGFRWSFVDPTE